MRKGLPYQGNGDTVLTKKEMPFFLLHQKLLETASLFPEKTALQLRISADNYKGYTYAEVAGLSKALGFYFISKGIRRGDRIAIILENRPEWPIFYFGALLSGATAVPIDPQLTGQEINNILSDSGAGFVVSALNADEVLRDLKHPPADFDFPQMDVEGPASIIYTSGTTAIPKGVVLSHKNFSSNFNSLSQLGICGKDDNILSVLPLHHSYPFMATLVLPLLLGARVTYIAALKPQEIASAMREAGVTMLVGVPSLFYLFSKGISEKIKAAPWPLRIRPLIAKRVRGNFGAKLRFFVSGGARLEPKVARDLSRLGFEILEGYGLTETSPVATFNPPGRQKFGSVGIPLPGVEIRISTPDKDGAGEVLIKGPNVMKGYYNNPKETGEAVREGWFYSGDLGYIDKDGYLFLTGRKKEVIVLSSGKNIYPEEIEAHYKRSPFIKELCVLGVLRNNITEELGAVIVPDMEYFKKAGEINIREKIKWDMENFSRELTAYKRIMSFIIAKEDLPMTRIGKLKRYEVQRKYGGEFGKEGLGMKSALQISRVQDPDEEDSGILSSEVGKKVVEFLARERGIKRALRAGDHLELDLGLDSLGRVELAAGLEKIFNINIPNEYIAEVFTIGDVILKLDELILEAAQGKKDSPVISGAAMWGGLLNKEPREGIRGKIDLSPGPLSKFAVFLGVKFLYAAFTLVFRLKIEGKKNIPPKGPFILCPNHSSYLDAFVICAGAPYAAVSNLFFLGFKDYFIQPLIKNMIKLIRVVPIDPSEELVNAMRASSLIIRNNKSLCIFPEGQRSIDGQVKKFKNGIGILAKELGVTLIPVYIEGTFSAWPRTRGLPRPHPVKVIFGRPLDNLRLLKAGKEKGARDDYEAIAVGLREEVLKLRSRD